MTSVNESNAYQRGKRDGYDIGYASSMENARRYGTSLRWWKLAVAFGIGFIMAVAFGVEAQTTHAQSTAQTSVTVTIGAEVPCNPVNCKEIPEEEPAQVENITQEQSLLQRIWSAILRVLN